MSVLFLMAQSWWRWTVPSHLKTNKWQKSKTTGDPLTLQALVGWDAKCNATKHHSAQMCRLRINRLMDRPKVQECSQSCSSQDPQTGPRPDGKGPLGFTLSFVTHGLLPVDSVLVLWMYGSTTMSVLLATSSTTLSTSIIVVKRVADSVLVRPFPWV